MFAGENKKFIMIISVAGKKLCQHLRIIVQIEVWNDDSDKFTFSIRQDLCQLILFISKYVKSL